MWSAPPATTTPRVIILKKECITPEDETATGPNYPRTYVIKLDIAKGQSIAKLKILDVLPNTNHYNGNLLVQVHPPNTATQVTTCSSGLQYVLTQVPSPSAGGTLELLFCAPIVGASHTASQPDDVTIQFSFYVPEFDSNGKPVLSPQCVPVLGTNGVKAEGDWTQTPLDPCDFLPPPPPLHVTDSAWIRPSRRKCLDNSQNVSFSGSWT